MLSSLSFCLSVKLLISPSNLKRALLGKVFLLVGFSLSSCHSLLACRVSAEKSADSLMEIAVDVTYCFQQFSLSLTFVHLITLCLSIFLLGFILPGTLCFLDLGDCFPSDVSYYLIKYFLRPFLFSFWDPYNANVGASDIFPEVSETVVISFYPLFCPLAVISTILSSSSLIHSSASLILLFIPSSFVFFFY